MKKGDKVLVPTGAGDHTVEGVIRSLTKTHAMVTVPVGSMAMGRRSTQALRKLDDLKSVGGEKKKTSKPKATSKSKSSKKKASKKKASKKATSKKKS